MLFSTGIATRVPDTVQDAAQNARNSAPFDSIWAANGSSGASSAFEQVMLSNDKLYVVLGVVLIIWIGLVVLLVRNDRRLASLERTVRENIPDEDPLGPETATGAPPTESTH